MNNRTLPSISVVTPVYLAEAIIPVLVERLKENLLLLGNDFEIILVDDGSPDNSWASILQACKNESRVKGVKLTRNFGQHKAITAGLAISRGDYVVVMDCDLQDDPVYIRDLVSKAQEGFDVVYTVKEEREHSMYKNLTTRFFNKVLNFLVDAKELQGQDLVGAYSLISRPVVNEFLKFGDYRRHYLMVLRWLGFPFAFVTIKHNKRFSGKSSYTWSKLLTHAIDGITSQSEKVLLLTVYSGFFLAFLSLAATVLIFVLYFVHGFQSGWASLAVLILFSSGITITSIGIVGVYVGRTFEQTKGRPLYVVDKLVNL
jgi:glycosyltransferase involved in cell wall biosynthesis